MLKSIAKKHTFANIISLISLIISISCLITISNIANKYGIKKINNLPKSQIVFEQDIKITNDIQENKKQNEALKNIQNKTKLDDIILTNTDHQQE